MTDLIFTFLFAACAVGLFLVLVGWMRGDGR